MNTENAGKVLLQYAPPAIIANIVAALYNIVDQIFIGQGVGYLGNAATNVAFPVTQICMCIGITLGIGSATSFSILLGRQKGKEVQKIAGNAYSLLFFSGLIMMIICLVFKHGLLYAFGATRKNIAYAEEYLSITALGLPFYMLSIGLSHLIRADGSPVWAMMASVSGAVLNTILDPLFIFGFHTGIAGAAWATVISEIVSAIFILLYIPRFQKTIITKNSLLPDFRLLKQTLSYGLSALFNNLSALVVQVVLNNLMRAYGASSIYGSDIPLAAAGIVSKLNTIFTSFNLGISQGAQPYNSFNAGAGNYSRIKKMYQIEFILCLFIGSVIVLLIQLFARPIILLFGSGNELYMQFAVPYLRCFFSLAMFGGVAIISGMYCSQTGNARTGALLALIRQVLLLVPFQILFASIYGINGIQYASPVSDMLAFLIACFVIHKLFQRFRKNEYRQSPSD